MTGERDLARAANELAERLPAPLEGLARVAYDYRWSWAPGGPELFRSIDAHRWGHCRENPVRLLQEAPRAALQRAAVDQAFLDRAATLEQAVRDAPGPFADRAPERPIAFVCAEYAVHGSLPIYSGGLGALSGDILKEASDRGLPMVGVGLMYSQGYFHQHLERSGWQQECWSDTDAERLPAAIVTGDDGRPLTVTVPIGGLDVVAAIWRVDVGRVPLLLLDADRPENPRIARWITARLYVGDPVTRLAQYALLGIGGIRALRAMGIEPGLVHLNEGHAALAALELGRGKADHERVVFTTHTPVPAGNDTYPAAQVVDTLGRFAAELGMEPVELLRLGRTHPDDEDEPFGVTQLALRVSQAANGVSRRHGHVARGMWRELWPDREEHEVPIGHVTNGVHLPTWVGGPMRGLLDRALGHDWTSRASAPETWESLDGVSDEELWSVRERQRADLVDEVRERSVGDRLVRGEPYERAEAAAHAFDPRVLTIGFARRLATYKRLGLLVRDEDRLLRLLGGDRPIQLLLAGKAHPADADGKRLVTRLFSLKDAPHVAERTAYLHDYDLPLAAQLVQGCDVWVNLPRAPLEASGTSGMKSAVNGGLHLSVLDGWWAEAYDGANGWAISGDVDPDPEAQDARDSAELYRLLEEEVVPAFYDRDSDGVPRAWLARMRASLRSVPPAFCAGRMLDDYVARVYEQGFHQGSRTGT